MVKKGKLLAALDAHRGRDYEAEKRKKQLKVADKRKRQKVAHDSDADEDEAPTLTEKSPKQNRGVGRQAQDVSEESSESELQHVNGDHAQDDLKPDITKVIQNGKTRNGATASQEVADDSDEDGDEDEDEEQESDVPLSDLEAEDLEDTIPHHRLTINNGAALLASCNRVSIIKHPKTPFHYHNSLISDLPAASSSIPDPNDDLTRELEFYRIARTAVVEARTLLKKEKIPFSRPNDYFAEMVKTDEHMGRVKKKMYDEAASKKAGQEARKLRDAKKFGKAVQVAKEQERAKERKSAINKIDELKRKRKGMDTGLVREDPSADLFQDIAVEEGAASGRGGKRQSSSGQRGRDTSMKRQKRDQKFGFGGKKRFSKSGDALSSADMRGFSEKRMKGGRGGGRGGASMGRKSQRPGKSRRAATMR